MSRSEAVEPAVIPDSLIREVCARLAAARRIRRTLPARGRLHIDRPLPFLCIHRCPPDRCDLGTERLVLGQASYLVASGEEVLQESLSALVGGLARTLADRFGAFLIVEIWSAVEARSDMSPPAGAPRPGFRIVTPRTGSLPTTIRALADALESMELPGPSAAVAIRDGGRVAPPGLPPLLTTTAAEELGCLMIGLEVTPFYRDPATGEPYPLLLHRLHREFSRALQKAFFDFVHVQTAHRLADGLRPETYAMLGRRTAVRAVWEGDRELAQIGQSFDLLLAVTPVNSEAAYAEFEAARFERAPAFHYRLLPIDPDLLKRRLYAIRLERVEDPVLASLLREKRGELDRQINLLEDRETPRFLYGSLQLYGSADETLRRLAEGLLSRLPTPDRREEDGHLDAAAFADRAREEIDAYRLRYPQMAADVEIRDDVPGLMVAHGKLLIGRRARVSRSRVEAALQHEVGTHLVTYVNGRAQPLRQLATGLPGYEELQEGLAVLAEYLVGGLDRSRLRTLAGRVIAVDRLVRGASFVEIFGELCRTYGFGRRAAFTMTMRVCRGGGFTKDIVYLRGLLNLLEYLKRGHDLEPLFAGKFNLAHVPLIQELQWRQTLRPTPLFPRYLGEAGAKEKLERLRRGQSVLDLIEGA